MQQRKVVIGTRRLFDEQGIFYKAAESQIKKWEKDGKTVVLVAVEHRFVGLLAISDTLKENAKKTVSFLRKMRMGVVMVTGDNERTAHSIAKKIGIKHVYAEKLPQEKAYIIQALQRKGKKVLMVGDGINDAPALAMADIGMAIGTGADVAIEASDISIIRQDLLGVVQGITISKKTMRNIKQNLFWALAYNTISIPIAALGFLAPWIAGAAMACSSVSVVLNALRLQKMKL